MSGTISSADVTRIVTALQELIKASYLTQQTLLNGITVSTTQPVVVQYTVANLPVGGTAGALAWASNGRNSGQGAGAGTGCVVLYNGTIWTAIWSGLQVTA